MNKQLIEAIVKRWNAASPLSRAMLITGVMAMVMSIVYLASRDTSSGFVPLYTGLSTKDAGELVAEIEKRKIPYRILDGGTAVLVPPDKVDTLRLELAADGFPSQGGALDELKQSNSFGRTKFEERLMYQLSLQHDLAKAISRQPWVEAAKVTIALPERSIFNRGDQRPTASVSLQVRGNHRLNSREIGGLKHLVATAVPEMSADSVAIIVDGRLVGAPPGTDGSGATAGAMFVVQEYEERLEKRLVELLTPVVGFDALRVRVTAEMDLSRVEETQEQYDPDNVTVRSERKFSDTNNARSSQPNGIVGATGNLPQTAGPSQLPASETQSGSERATTEVEYAVPRTIRRRENPLGSVKRLSVAVLIDSMAFGADAPAEAEKKPDEEEGEDKAIEVPSGVEGTPVRPAPNLDALSDLVKKAVGFDSSRGDELKLALAPFAKQSADSEGWVRAEDEVSLLGVPDWIPVTLISLLGMGMMGIALVRTEKKREQERQEELRRQQEQAAAMTEREQSEHERVHSEKSLREDIRKLCAANISATSEVFKEWLNNTGV